MKKSIRIKVISCLGVLFALFLLVNLSPKEQTSLNLSIQSEANTYRTMSSKLDFDQLLRVISREFQLTEEQARKHIGYTEQMAQSAIHNGTTYRVFSQNITVNRVYQPSLLLYCETSESGNFRAIKSILSVQLKTTNPGLEKHFSGDVFAYLEDPNRIFYTINGDFYDQKTATLRNGLTLRRGDGVTERYDPGPLSNHFYYSYIEDWFTF
ncbi:hypothetical protein [Candidatus Enterococcus mangumiae]|uniref:Uncharacterized protein n=1 Tax=Candidatus Enterococcus mangumiae TaxID=2230878 RepID=A0ABZ2SSA2_9ENTE|nr:hypothetical protein [Enterococcus sp. DIV1094]MBO0488780.1 hypothetical protein [Enterococcus sp. DIV1094]